MISCKQFREFVVRPALDSIGYYNPSLEELLVAIVANHSDGGFYCHAPEEGTGLGIYNMEPSMHDELWLNHLNKLKGIEGLGFFDKIIQSNYLVYKRETDFNGNIIWKPDSKMLIYNMFYSTQMASVFFHRVGKVFPDRRSPEAIASFYKQHWSKKADENRFVAYYKKFLSESNSMG